MKIGI